MSKRRDNRTLEEMRCEGYERNAEGGQNDLEELFINGLKIV